MLDLLGEPIVYRIIESLRKSGVGPIFLITDDDFANHVALRDITRWRIHVRNSPREGLRTATRAALTTCRESGSRSAIVMQASKYVELNVAELLRFHAGSEEGVDLFIGRPDVLERYGVAIGIDAQHILFDIEADRAGTAALVSLLSEHAD